MSLSSISAVTAPTSIATTGGTAKTLSEIDRKANGNLVVADLSEDDVRKRITAEFGISEPRPNSGAPLGYSQARARCYLKVPVVVDGTVATVNSMKIEASWDPATPIADRDVLIDLAAQLIFLADNRSFFTDLNKS